MLPYWLLFLFWAAGALQYERAPEKMGGSAAFRIATIATALIVGLRWEVGGDWGNYQRTFEQIALLKAGQAISYTDPAYGLLNWMASRLGLTMVAVNMVCAAIFMWGVTAFAERQANPWLVVAVAVPYFIIVVGMGYTRQATAIGLVLVGLSVAERKGLMRVVLYVAAGAMFHKSAALALPLFAAGLLRRNALVAIVGLFGSVLLYAFVLRGSANNLIDQYASSDYQSGGAGVRVAMNVLAATIFLFYRKKMDFSPFEAAYWTTSAILSYLSVLALAGLASSVGVDRLALFLIPLQLAVYSRLPYALSRGSGVNGQVMLAILLYSAAVLLIYLNFGAMVHRWIPYRMAPFVSERY